MPADNSETALATQTQHLDDLRTFEMSLLNHVQGIGLPTLNVLVPVEERIRVFANLQAVVDRLPEDRRTRSTYVSKFIAAAAAGLFDAALNYLWDETISELRSRIAQYDVTYFFDVAVTNNERRKHLNSAEDLDKITDQELITGANQIGLISDIAFRHLDYIRYMRNWVSAAHPNQNSITGLQLITWLETCVNEILSLPLSHVTIEIGRLLVNIKTHALSQADATSIGTFFTTLEQERVDNLISGFFGIYCQPDTVTTVSTRDNIQLLAPRLWPRVSEVKRKHLGVRYAQFQVNNDRDPAQRARQFLDVVGGAGYIPEGLRAAEIEIALDNLLNAHNGYNNFYNEPPFANQLARLMSDAHARIPPQIEERYVLALTTVFLTNGNGTTRAAEPIYRRLLQQLNSAQAFLAITSFTDSTIASRLQFDLCERKYRTLLEMLEGKITAPAVREVIEQIKSFAGPLSRLRDDSNIKRQLENLRRIGGS